MEYIKIDQNNNIIKHSDYRVDETYLEIGSEIKWKALIERDGVQSEMFVSGMIEGDKIIKAYDNINELKACEENGIMTIRLKTINELKQEKCEKLSIQLLNDPNIKAIVDGTFKQMFLKDKSGINQSNIMFSDQECEDWQNFYASLAHDNWDLTNVTIDQITPEFLGIPAIPEVFKNRFM